VGIATQLSDMLKEDGEITDIIASCRSSHGNQSAKIVLEGYVPGTAELRLFVSERLGQHLISVVTDYPDSVRTCIRKWQTISAQHVQLVGV
jgi:hypothetical protein